MVILYTNTGRHWCTEPCTERPIHVLSRKLVLNMPKEPCVAEDSQGDDSAVPTTKQEYTETATCYYLVLGTD